MTAMWAYLHHYLIRDHVRFYETGDLLEMMAKAGFQQARTEFSLRKFLWRGKAYTSVALISGVRIETDTADAQDPKMAENQIIAERLPKLDLPERFAALKDKKMLVTGAAGFIGGALFRRFAAYGCDVTGSVLYPAEAEALKKEGFKAKVLDLASDEPFEPFVEGMDIVFNVAAMFRETEHGEAIYTKVNRDGALKLCKAAAAAGVERFVHCSTVGVHGDVKEIPCKETTPYNPTNHYTRAKLKGELAVIEFGRSLPADGMVVTANRPGICYGPGDTRMLILFKNVLRNRFVIIGKAMSSAIWISSTIKPIRSCSVRWHRVSRSMARPSTSPRARRSRSIL